MPGHLFSSSTSTLHRTDGPAHPVNAKPGVGFTSARPWRYEVVGTPGDRVACIVPDTGLEGRTIASNVAVSYVVHPVFDAVQPDVRDSYAATAVCLDVVFDDGARLTDSTPRDHDGVPADPAAQYDSKTIAVDQWTRKSISLDGLVRKRIARVELVLWIPPRVDGTTAERTLVGYLDTIAIEAAAALSDDVVEHVRTTRGTQSSDRFSRGNNAPLVAAGPHPFVFGLPMTDGGNRGWPYSYHEASRVGFDSLRSLNQRGEVRSADRQGQGRSADRREGRIRPHLQSFATSHIPSPWMGDRGVFQFFPSPLAHPDPDRDARALAFDHAAEHDRPHRYAVTLDAGDHGALPVELTAGMYSVWLRTTFPADVGSIVFDQLDAAGSINLSADEITGFVDGPGGLVRVPRMYVYVRVDTKILGMHRYPGHQRESVLAAITVDAARRPVTLAVGTSFISVEQARCNLDFDTAGGTFDDVLARAHRNWHDALSVLDVDDATPDQLTTLYSCLYRVNLYPNQASENVGTQDHPHWQYASPFGDPPQPDTPARTGRTLFDGQLTVTDGFWDSYRTSWPLRTLLAPKQTAALLDGFVEHYRAGGWVSRWSAPGPADIMTGTSSDTVFADAALAGLADYGFDEFDAYDSCLRNATTPSSDPRVGRKGITRSLFTGYADTQTHEGMSWTVDAAINDAAIAAFSRHLAQRHPDHPRRDEFIWNATWFTARAGQYATVFDAEVGFFRGRTPDGSWRPDFEPRRWGTDYTETNAWGTAFTAPQDGEGLATLHGGRVALEAKLDAFFAEPETGRDDFRGGYPIVIHEMREARDTRMGMLALSNQPAHHIPFMYAFASRPGSTAHAKTQRIVSDAVRRLFLGSEVGQGYPGDEDNGEMSAWYLWAASGLYPLTVASGRYVLCAPSFRRLSWTLENGAVIEIVAPGAGGENVYIQGVRIDGQEWSEIVVDCDRLAEGARIEFDLGPEPSDWAQGSVPPSITEVGQSPRVPGDLTHPHEAERCAIGGAAAFDDDSSTPGVRLAIGDVVGWRFDEPTSVTHYTVTVDEPGEYEWDVEVVDAQGDWGVVRIQEGRFKWERQTRVFGLASGGAGGGVRLRARTGMTVVQLELLELGADG